MNSIPGEKNLPFNTPVPLRTAAWAALERGTLRLIDRYRESFSERICSPTLGNVAKRSTFDSMAL